MEYSRQTVSEFRQFYMFEQSTEAKSRRKQTHMVCAAKLQSLIKLRHSNRSNRLLSGVLQYKILVWLTLISAHDAHVQVSGVKG